MSKRIFSTIDFYRDVVENKSDPRVRNWPMMSSPFPTVIICLAYVYFSKRLGPKLMEKRKPFDLRNVLVVYNFFQFIFSIWLFYEASQSGWFTGYSFTCQPVDYSNHPKALRMARTFWWYYFSKFTEFLDTVFFILRKKNNQVTTLHVIHHGIMPFSSWIGVKFAPGGHVTFAGLLNTFVHIIMYLYYMIAAMGPNYQKYIWWKKYLTALQMVQFVAILIHEMQLFFIDCNFPKLLTFYALLHGLMFLFLFSNFYKSSYLAKETRKTNVVRFPASPDIYSANKVYPVPGRLQGVLRTFIGRPLDLTMSALIQKASFERPKNIPWIRISCGYLMYNPQDVQWTENAIWPVEETRMKLNGESGNGATQRICHEESLNRCKVCYMDVTRNGYIEDVNLVNVKKKD